MEELKECPNGCKDAYVVDETNRELEVYANKYHVQCGCGWSSPERGSEQEAVEAWNQRQEPESKEWMIHPNQIRRLYTEYDGYFKEVFGKNWDTRTDYDKGGGQAYGLIRRDLSDILEGKQEPSGWFDIKDAETDVEMWVYNAGRVAKGLIRSDGLVFFDGDEMPAGGFMNHCKWQSIEVKPEPPKEKE